MTYTGLENLTDTSFKAMLQFPSIDTPLFYPIILFALFMITTISSYFFERDRVGKGNFLSSLAVSSLTILVLAMILRLLELISREILIIHMVVSLVFIGLWMLTNK